MGREEHQDEQPMLSSAFYVYNRPARDVSWKWTFLLFLALTVIGGIYAGVHRFVAKAISQQICMQGLQGFGLFS
jgi:hypothetical protein